MLARLQKVQPSSPLALSLSLSSFCLCKAMQKNPNLPKRQVQEPCRCSLPKTRVSDAGARASALSSALDRWDGLGQRSSCAKQGTWYGPQLDVAVYSEPLAL